MKNLLFRFCSGAALGAALVVSANAAFAENYPQRPVTLVVPFAAGGGADASARLFAEAASRALGQPLVIENRAGAGGVTGAAYVANAEADGYTLFWANPSSLSTAQTVFKELPYDPIQDFSYISRAVVGHFAFVVNNDVPAKSVTELVEYAKSTPGGINYGSAGVGSITHLAMALFNVRSEAGMEHIPYQGSAPAYTALMSGEVELMLATMAYVATLPEGGAIRYVPLQMDEYKLYFPDFAELEAPGDAVYPASTWYGLAGPAGLPEDIVQKLSDVIKQTSVDPAFIEAAGKSHYVTIHEAPENLVKVVEVEQKIWTAAAEMAGVEPQ